MKDLTANKVQQWMSLIMIGCFCWVTYFNFQGFFLKMIEMFVALPLWWFLIVLPLFAMAVIWSISLGEREIKELEKQVQKNQKVMTRRERCLRLIHYDIKQIPYAQFNYYCADVLRLLGYHEVRVICNGAKDMIALNPNGDQVYIKCVATKEEQFISQSMIEDFYANMLSDKISQGLFMTTVSFSPSAVKRAQECQIKCMDGQDLNELILLVTREERASSML